MIGILARVVIGVALSGIAGAMVYKCLTPDTVKQDIQEELREQDTLEEAFKAKVRKKSKHTISVTVLNDMDKPLCNLNLEGDEVSDDIHVGDEILLKDA